MTPGDIQVRHCPSCTRLVRRMTLGSGHLFGARLWTDGYLQAPGVPFVSPLARCPDCGHVFWWEDAAVVGTWRFGSRPDVDPGTAIAWESAPEVPLEPGQHALGEMVIEASSPERERLLRTHSWWGSNHAEREPGEAPRRGVASAENMRRLLELVDPADPDQRVMAAELHRELGEHERARELLEAWLPAELRVVGDTIRALAREGNTRVAVIQRESGVSTKSSSPTPPPPVSVLLGKAQPSPAMTPRPALSPPPVAFAESER